MSHPEPIPCSSSSRTVSVMNDLSQMLSEGAAVGGSGADNLLNKLKQMEALMNSQETENSDSKKKKKDKLPLAQREKQTAIRKGLLRLQRELKALGEVKTLLSGAVDDLQEELDFITELIEMNKYAVDIVRVLDIPSFDEGSLEDLLNKAVSLLENEKPSSADTDMDSGVANMSGMFETSIKPDATLVSEILDE